MVMEIPLAGKNLIVARKLFVLTLAGRYFRLGGDLRKVMSDADEGTLSWQFSISYGPQVWVVPQFEISFSPGLS
jgi:hypothetical protein